MTSPVRIFVSHSSKDNELTGKICDELKRQQDAALSVDVLVDLEKLEAADPWPVQLHEMMADCHAAVVLLTPNAVESDWVRKEMTILTWRSSLEESFKTFVLEKPGLDQSKVRANGFAPLQHRQIQGIVNDDPVDIASKILQRLKADAVKPARTQFERMVVALAESLDNASAATLAAVADRLGTERPPWRPGNAAKERFIERVATKILRGELGDYGATSELLEDLRPTNLTEENRRLVLRLAGPLWVDWKCAAQMGGLVAKSANEVRCGHVALNGNYTARFTGKMYVERAFPLAFDLRVCGLNPALAGNDADVYQKAICKFVCEEVGGTYASIDSERDVVKELANEGPWLFVVLPLVDSKMLKEMSARFPRVRFIVSTGSAGDDTQLLDVPLLVPRLDPATEARQYADYGKSLRVISGKP